MRRVCIGFGYTSLLSRAVRSFIVCCLISTAFIEFACGRENAQKSQSSYIETCTGEFGTGSGLAGSYVGDKCRLRADSDEERRVQAACKQNEMCQIRASVRATGQVLIIERIVSAHQIAIKSPEDVIRDQLNREIRGDPAREDEYLSDSFRSTIRQYRRRHKNDADQLSGSLLNTQEPESWRISELSSHEIDSSRVLVYVIMRLHDVDQKGLPVYERYRYLLEKTKRGVWLVEDMIEISDNNAVSLRKRMASE